MLDNEKLDMEIEMRLSRIRNTLEDLADGMDELDLVDEDVVCDHQERVVELLDGKKPEVLMETNSLEELTGQTKGVVIDPDGYTMMVNWSGETGVPDNIVYGEVIYDKRPIKCVLKKREQSVNSWIDSEVASEKIKYKEDILSGRVSADLYLLDDGTLVFVPDIWKRK